MLLHKKVLFISNIFLYFNSMCCTFSCASFTKHGACINYIQSGYTSNNLSFTYICTKSIIQKTDRLEYSMLLLLVIYFSLVRCKHWVQCESFTDMYKKQVTVIACLISLFVFSLLPFGMQLQLLSYTSLVKPLPVSLQCRNIVLNIYDY